MNIKFSWKESGKGKKTSVMEREFKNLAIETEEDAKEWASKQASALNLNEYTFEVIKEEKE